MSYRNKSVRNSSKRLRSLGVWCVIVAIGWLGLATNVNAEIRSAKVAGRFYPEEQTELRDLIDELLKRQSEPLTSQKPRILIVPHAGYEYSGLIAAAGFRQLQGRSYDGVVVVGFTHRARFNGSSVETRDAYETPLGLAPVHQEALQVLLALPGLGHLEEAHESDEHSVEVELPFLQMALEHPRIVPILMGSDRLEDAERLAQALATLSQLGDFLYIFSTDLSHYHSYEEAEKIDEGTVNAMLFETPQAVSRLFDSGQIEACGRGPILTSLLLAGKLHDLKRELLYHANSGDTAGNPSSVVGYAAIGMYERSAPAGQRLSAQAGHALVLAARQALEHTLTKQPGLGVGALDQYPELSRAQGLFVTLKRHGQLRGCIGRIQTNDPLGKSVGSVALDAALHDGRFPPVTAEELPDLDVEVSVLTPLTPLRNLKDLVPGRDGVILQAEGHSGVFLPQVWEETGWTRLEFLRELASQKAGLSPDAWQRAGLQVFQAQVFEER